ncbi:MAG: filamentous hemagglutinin N-terminal domain-containing protein, partial [Gammaproteobacteria bacterium]|nr:filamentous hemagglutinin N-terminal domain-containing protein [Gammaproteobacteria bacterium]
MTQRSDRAILHWQSFDVGPDRRVVFDQPSASAVALNRIYQGSPSRIHGQLSANGQVYLINQNGVLFGPGARVNVHTLVASTLDLSDALFNGVGLAGAINEGTGGPAFQGAGPMGALEVAAGARIESAAGGRVMLIGPTVSNAGTVSTPDGQAVFAASEDAVYLAASSDPNLRGLWVEVGKGGEVTNLGEVLAARGNVSLVGLAVNQSGRVRATTSTSLGGSVRLVAQDRARVDVTASAGNRPQATRGGRLTLGPGSATEVLPDPAPGDRAVDAQEQPRSQVTLAGASVRLAAGASVVAPGGAVAATAARDPSGALLPTTPRNDSGVVLEPGSRIDVSGDTSAVLPVSRNVVELELRGNELRDAPLQRDGPLRNRKVYVDVRRGTPLADASGATAAIRRGVVERLAHGGTVSLRSEGDLHLMPGSAVDVSGGTVRYESGVVPVTTLMTHDRRLVDLADADPDRLYAGVFGDLARDFAKWGQQDRFGLAGGDARWEAGYVEGRDAGSIDLVARALVLSGDLVAGTTPGPNQRRATRALAPGAIRPFDQQPSRGLLTIGDGTQAGLPESEFRTPAVRFGDLAADPSGADRPLPAGLELLLDPARLAVGGIGRLVVYSNGRIRVPAGVDLSLPAGGSLHLVGGEVEVAGAVTVPAGSVRIEGRKTPGVAAGASQVTVAGSGAVDVRGLWVEERPQPSSAARLPPLLVDGGSVTLAASGPLTLAGGSRIDASGGAQVAPSGKLSPGRGGRIELSVVYEDARPLDLLGSVAAYGLEHGGALALRAPGFWVGGVPGTAADGTLTLDSGFFGRGGFQSYDLRASHTGIRVESGARVDLTAENLVLPGTGRAVAADGGRPALETAVLPAWRRRPTHLSLAFAPENGLGVRLD